MIFPLKYMVYMVYRTKRIISCSNGNLAYFIKYSMQISGFQFFGLCKSPSSITAFFQKKLFSWSVNSDLFENHWVCRTMAMGNLSDEEWALCLQEYQLPVLLWLVSWLWQCIWQHQITEDVEVAQWADNFFFTTVFILVIDI